jgi:phosphopantothenoylcysteine decarboxylase/phosphopantothenate--cysteine ligase
MNYLKNKNILLAVTGSIAAYKASEIIRELRCAGANVKVVMTKDATLFITELTLQALSGQPVYKELLDPTSEASMSHISLAKWADLLLVAPATANIIAKFAAGIADDLLTTLYLATSAPVIISPAMNQQMWHHLATQQNCGTLLARGNLIYGPSAGEQACGDVGLGRMLEPSDIIANVQQFFSPKSLAGTRIMITAGPTREPIDPVRYLSNYSSGKMGYALAGVAADLGADVLLISGPTQLPVPVHVNSIRVETAEEMHQAVTANIANYQILIAAAAVADYHCEQVAKQKIKKDALPVLNLARNVDILKELSLLEHRPFTVGFAAETEALLDNARQKLHHKKLDMIIANQVGLPNSGFESDYNQVSVLTKNEQFDLTYKTKQELAEEIIPLVFSFYQGKG